ncbi:E3 ubiquitin-protein ligase SIAH1A-like isoform X4 [Choristoneura fumiferana]|uniref:E3 ubiquitin-protein ligase SIAH1A-like isoform X4 n=1 Tax=Choristoneura fumiferana TaxID=7141 RepID=UPI003D157F6E
MGSESSKCDSLERARTPYSEDTTSRDLDTNIRQANTQRLYPNLDHVTNGVNRLNARNDDDYVVISRYQQRYSSNPSAPPAADVTELPEAAPAYSAPTSPQPRCGPSNPGPSDVPHSVLPKKNPRARSVSRARALDPRYNCPTCTQRLGLTIYICEKGHGTCKDCKENNRTCGSENGRCGAPITGMRNIALEAFVAEHGQNQLSKCENEKCTLRFNVHGMEKHLKECPFGVIDCPMGKFLGKCSSRCKIEDLASHFDSCHKEQRGAELDKEMFILLSAYIQKLYLIKNGPYNFLLHLKVSEIDHMVYMAVQLLGTTVSSSKWSYEFHVYNKSQPRRKYQHVINCHAMSTPLKEIFTDKNCAALPIGFATSFVNEGALTFKLFITKTGGNRPRKRNDDLKPTNLEN